RPASRARSLAVVSQAARKVLEGPAQVAFFRAVGHRYALADTGSLLCAGGDGRTIVPPELRSTGVGGWRPPFAS
ncbi:MAG: hypothetical protein M0Z42_09785, partial [Actinomycetota bacterium]|nr:hypothetical protein [Actinomycetota bacterium]